LQVALHPKRGDRAQSCCQRRHGQTDSGASASLRRLRRSLPRGIKRLSLGEAGG
jgi:hypothetical protein